MSDESREVISNILNWDEELQTFLQSKGTKDLDASVPLMPLIRFISPVDSMWRSTVKVIEARLVEDTLIRRYEAERTHVAGGEVAHCVLILVHRIP
jgi:GH15 family glucan-1,4-alpha-glucosidase